jgi:predicted N-acetyltransferase YhbS
MSLVAVDREILGHICYSLSAVQDSGLCHHVLTFGPVSVLPSEQGKGIGAEIINFSLEKVRSMGFTAIIIQGYPSYYKRFCFKNGINFGVSDMYGNFPKALQVLELQPGAMSGIHGKHTVSSAFETDTSALRNFDRSFPERDVFRTVSHTAFHVMSSLADNDPEPESINRLSVCRDRLVDETRALP